MTGAVPLTIVLAGKISLVALGLVASWLDVSKRRLPNWLSLLTLAAGLIVTGLSAGFSAVGSHLAHAAVALLVGMVASIPPAIAVARRPLSLSVKAD